MDIFSVLSLIGGLALFLYGMELMGDGLKNLAGGKLESVLARLTSTKWRGFLLGFVVTAVIQSSSATTVMLVGFVNSGIMKLGQTISIILGANIGTTVTAWLLSLTGIDAGTTVFLKLLKPDSFTPILAAIGVVIMMMSKNDAKKNTAMIFVGFSILMFGMNTMSDAVSGLKDNEAFTGLLTMFSNNPVMGIIVGTVFTAIIQSSSASVGILQALSLSCFIPCSTALPIILGQNIGTTITPIISSITGNKESRRVAISCLYIKMIGVVVVSVAFYVLHSIFDFTFMSSRATVFNIAIIHTSFNVISTIIIMPFCSQIEKLAVLTFKDGTSADKVNVFDALDDRFLSVPTFAVEKCRELVWNMAKLANDTIMRATELLSDFDQKKFDEIINAEKMVDKYEDKTSTYLVKIAANHMSARDSKVVTELLHCISDIERISDHAVNIAETANEIYRKKIAFSSQAQSDIKVMTNATLDVLDLAVGSLINNDVESAKKVEPLEQVIDRLKHKIKNKHILRLKDGQCTIELGFILLDLITNYERISDHCSNIALCLIEIANDSFETHKYVKNLKNSNDYDFDALYQEYKEKYSL